MDSRELCCPVAWWTLSFSLFETGSAHEESTLFIKERPLKDESTWKSSLWYMWKKLQTDSRELCCPVGELWVFHFLTPAMCTKNQHGAPKKDRSRMNQLAKVQLDITESNYQWTAVSSVVLLVNFEFFTFRDRFLARRINMVHQTKTAQGWINLQKFSWI